MNLLSLSMKMSFLQVFWDGDCKHLPRLHRMWTVLWICHMGVSIFFIFLSKISTCSLIGHFKAFLGHSGAKWAFQNFLGILIQSNGFVQQELKKEVSVSPMNFDWKDQNERTYHVWHGAQCGITKIFFFFKATNIQVINLNKHCIGKKNPIFLVKSQTRKLLKYLNCRFL